MFTNIALAAVVVIISAVPTVKDDAQKPLIVDPDGWEVSSIYFDTEIQFELIHPWTTERELAPDLYSESYPEFLSWN